MTDDECRQSFEKWAVEECLDIARWFTHPDRYVNYPTQTAWLAWQQSRTPTPISFDGWTPKHIATSRARAECAVEVTLPAKQFMDLLDLAGVASEGVDVDVEVGARAIYELQPETITRNIARLKGTMLDVDVEVIPFDEACNKDNAIAKAKACARAWNLKEKE